MTYFAKPGTENATRVCDLKFGDIFETAGIIYVVTKVSDKVYYRPLTAYHLNYFGLKSQKFVRKLLYATLPPLPKARL
jgi:hypothetical protein